MSLAWNSKLLVSVKAKHVILLKAFFKLQTFWHYCVRWYAVCTCTLDINGIINCDLPLWVLFPLKCVTFLLMEWELTQGAFKKNPKLIYSIFNSFTKMVHDQMKLIVRLEVLSEVMFAPSSYTAHLVQGSLTVSKEQASGNAVHTSDVISPWSSTCSFGALLNQSCSPYLPDPQAPLWSHLTTRTAVQAFCYIWLFNPSNVFVSAIG